MAPEANHQQRVTKGFANPAKRAAAPAHGIAKLLKFHQVDLALEAGDQPQIGIAGGQFAPIFAVELIEQRLCLPGWIGCQ